MTQRAGAAALRDGTDIRCAVYKSPVCLDLLFYHDPVRERHYEIPWSEGCKLAIWKGK